MSNTPAFAAFGVPSLGALAKPQASNISTPSTPRPKAPMKGRKQASPPSKATASSPSSSSTAARQSTTAPSNPSPYPPDDLSPAPNRNDSAKQSNKRALDLSDAELTQIRNRISADLASIGIPGVTATDLRKLNPPDIYEREMEVMAEVRAYFHVSYKVRYFYELAFRSSSRPKLTLILPESH